MSDKKSVSGNILDLQLLKKILHLVKPYRSIYYLSIVLTFVVAVIGPVIPYLIQHTIDHKILAFDGPGLRNFTILIVLILLIQAVLQYYQSYFLNWLGQNAILHMRQNVFKHIMAFKNRMFDKTPLGTFITRTISDVEAVSSVFSQGLINIIGDLLQVVIILAILFYIDWQLTLVCLSVFPFLLFSSYIFKEAIKKTFQDVRNQVSRLNTFLQEHITGMQIIQIFNKEKQEIEKFKSINASHRDAHIRSVLYYSIFFPVIEIFSAITIALIVWYGAQNVISGNLTFGILVAFILYLSLLFRPVRQIADRFNTLQMGMVASERIFNVMEKNEFIPDTGQLSPSNINGHLTFENVSFAYDGDDYILKDMSLNVEAGQMLAIVGATGAGKSTIINLVNRMYDIQNGCIKIDHHDIKEYKLHWLRKQIAVVQQDVFLFSDSIANNIKLYNIKITDQDIINAAEMIGADKFINELQGGIDHVVQERGVSLSAGQRQIIAFIRAVIQNPAILILDEATSSVDNETEELIQHATEVLLSNRTSIVIAHRLATVRKADQIIVLEKGRIIEKGTHKELLAKNGTYKQLCKLQFSEFLV